MDQRAGCEWQLLMTHQCQVDVHSSSWFLALSWSPAWSSQGKDLVIHHSVLGPSMRGIRDAHEPVMRMALGFELLPSPDPSYREPLESLLLVFKGSPWFPIIQIKGGVKLGDP